MVKQKTHGLSDWIWQRITAATMLLYSLVVLLRMAMERPLGADGWKAWFVSMPFKVLTLLFLLALMYHAWLGVKEILMDYAHNIKLRAFLQALVTLALLGYAAWAITILWSI